MTVPTDDSKDRVWFLSHAVEEKNLEPGDHIYVHRKCGIYTHHGIYIGDEDENEVIHFSGLEKKEKSTASVESCSLKTFLDGSKLRLVAYNAPCWHRFIKKRGSCHCNESRPASEVIQTAYFYLNNPEEWGAYSLFKNNCEHFAIYCKTERNAASQLEFPIHGPLSSILDSKKKEKNKQGTKLEIIDKQ